MEWSGVHALLLRGWGWDGQSGIQDAELGDPILTNVH